MNIDKLRELSDSNRYWSEDDITEVADALPQLLAVVEAVKEACPCCVPKEILDALAALEESK